jgi:hypothetical protein
MTIATGGENASDSLLLAHAPVSCSYSKPSALVRVSLTARRMRRSAANNAFAYALCEMLECYTDPGFAYGLQNGPARQLTRAAVRLLASTPAPRTRQMQNRPKAR